MKKEIENLKESIKYLAEMINETDDESKLYWYFRYLQADSVLALKHLDYIERMYNNEAYKYTK